MDNSEEMLNQMKTMIDQILLEGLREFIKSELNREGGKAAYEDIIADAFIESVYILNRHGMSMPDAIHATTDIVGEVINPMIMKIIKTKDKEDPDGD